MVGHIFCHTILNVPSWSTPFCSRIWSDFMWAYERRLLLIIFWKAAFVWVTPYLVQLTFSLEACSWKNGDLVFQRWSFFSILETCMGIDDPYVKKPRWRRNWNAISKMIKDGLAEGMVTRKLCVEVLDRYPLPRSHRHGGFEKKMFPSTSYSFLFQIKAVAHMLS